MTQDTSSGNMAMQQRLMNIHMEQPYYFGSQQQLCHTFLNYNSVSLDVVLIWLNCFSSIHWPSIESPRKELKRRKKTEIACNQVLCLSWKANQVHWSRLVLIPIFAIFETNAPLVQYILLPLWWLGVTTFQTTTIECHHQRGAAFG